MEQIFEGYSPACQQAVIESRKQKDKLFYVFNKVINGVVYVLTDKSDLEGNLLNAYQNGMVYVKPKEKIIAFGTIESVGENKVEVKKEETK